MSWWAFWRAFFGTWNTLFWNFWWSKSGSATCTGFFWKPGQVLWSMLEQHAKHPYHGPAHVLDVLQCLVPNGCRWTWLFWRLPCWYFLQPETTTWTSYFNSMIPNHYYKKMVFHHFHPFTPRKLNSSPLKKWCLEDDPFLLGPGNFSGKTRC